jgi:hypothetical protein
MKKLLLITALLMLCRTIFAQTEPCGYEAFRNHLIEQDSSNKILYHAKKQWVQQYRLENGFGNIGISAMPDSISCPTTRYIIPVVVHIVHLPSDNSPGTGTNISDGQVNYQIEKLNQDFSGTGIQFCLAQKNEYGNSISGIARYSNTASTHKMPSEISSLFSLSNFAGTGSDKYLNIYVVHTKSKII